MNFVLLMAPEGMHINSLSHTVIVVYVANSLLKELLKFTTNFATLPAFRQSIICVDFPTF